ncbi:MAG TPA: FAD-dependent tricarballylate dehydrogenase TcuA [Candidatus Limnocylindrales bacterium]|nr:FAD-dependent tricarballylate dehydrogenase TcuA [Candidatus Limnocylindrales bacterium]
MTARTDFDVVVVGAGNAGLCAALAASEEGARVLLLERAPQESRGGNSFFTGGLVRFPYRGIDDLRQLVPELGDREAGSVDVGEYSREAFFEDMARITEYQADPDLVTVLVDRAFETMTWLRARGVRFALALSRQAFKSGEKFRFWGGAPVEFVGGGAGLVERLFDEIGRREIEVWYGARARQLVTDDEDRVTAIRVRHAGETQVVRTRAVVLASGGFEANAEMRARYLGPDWDLVKVRGTEFNTGDGITMAMNIGAQPFGHWSGCHAVAWDVNAPATGDRRVGESFQKHSYPLGIVVNRLGARFIDEGADFRNYTYAKYGKEILKQPGMVAFQIFDAKVTHMLRDEYRIREVTKVVADTLEELARGLDIWPEGFTKTVRDYNAAVMDRPFDPSIKDGKGTVGLTPPKSNWALPIDTPPFSGYAVACGITFTFGGVRIDPDARVLDTDGQPIRSLFAAGEMVGGLFYHNYPGGTGLTSGAVFGRLAGRNAARAALVRVNPERPPSAAQAAAGGIE